MKRIFTRLGNNKLLLIFVIILQILIIVLIINPFSIISQNDLNSTLNEVVKLANDPDFRNASIIKVTNADVFKKQYLLSDKYSAIKDNDYVLLINSKFIVFRKDEDKIVFQGDAPSSMLDSTRLGGLISTKAKTMKLISVDEQPAIKFYNDSTDKDIYKDYFIELKNGDVIAFFAANKIVVVYNIQTDSIENSKKFGLL